MAFWTSVVTFFEVINKRFRHTFGGHCGGSRFLPVCECPDRVSAADWCSWADSSTRYGILVEAPQLPTVGARDGPFVTDTGIIASQDEYAA